MATSNPKTIGFAEGISKAALEAMNKFDGPAKGIMLKPNELSKTSINSINDDIQSFLQFQFKSVKPIYRFAPRKTKMA
jgi:hypothetical protein